MLNERVFLGGRQAVGFGDCDQWFWKPWESYPTEDDIKSGDQSMTTLVEALDVAISQCASIPDTEKQLWKSTVYATYERLHSDIADYVSGKTQVVTVPIPTDTGNAVIRSNLKCRLDELRKNYESARARVAAYCGQKSVPPPAPILPGPAPGDGGGKGEDWTGTVKAVATSAAVVTVVGSVVYIAARLLPEKR